MMAFTPFQAPALLYDQEFYMAIDTLKNSKALPEGSFHQQIPFFKFNFMSKESQMRELFQTSFDVNMYKTLLKKIVSQPEDEDLPAEMMTFAQICLYKVLPCPDPHCSGRPREIVTHNQYKDSEFECPFYHHDRDRRRIVITSNIEGEFVYKANYYEEGRSNADRDNYSQNYFESMFHPLYYKMFRCKREHCNSCYFCPFFHHEQEKKSWDKTFSTFLKKDRITYVKDKQKYYESTSNSSNEARELKGSDDESPNKVYNQNSRQQRNNRNQKSPKIPGQSYNRQPQNEGKQGKLQFSNDKRNENRKGSGDSFGMNTNSFGMFNNTSKMMNYRVC